MPGYISYEKVYEGGDVECGGYSASVRAADGTLTKAEITYSDLQNVKAKFDVALPAGEYTLCVYTRSGMGDEFGVKKATRKVTVK